MADQHLLTDETCDGLVWFSLDGLTELSEYDYVIMRAAADWQLERVIEWCIYSAFENDDDLHIQWKAIDALKKAMRPTQEDN